MAVALRELRDAYIWVMRDLPDPRTHDFFFVKSFPVVVFVVFSYLAFVMKIGPSLMQNIRPFKLQLLMTIYNIIQIITCAYIIIRGFPLLFQHNIFCTPMVDLSDEYSLGIQLTFLYYTLKYVDLLDTVFFVLRKKENQITFLHLFHHSGMVLVGWVGAKFVPTGHSYYVIYINTFVHLIMYTYYLITGLNENAKKQVWWKKHLTQLQLVQFGILSVLFTFAMLKPGCTYPWVISISVVVQNLVIGLLFADFYNRIYCLKKSNKT